MTHYNPYIHQRRSIRLKNYDYSQAGAYFLTICVNHRECLFGAVEDNDMQFTEIGNIVVRCWQQIPDHCPNIELDAYVVMPNHIHGILVIQSSDDGERDGYGRSWGRS